MVAGDHPITALQTEYSLFTRDLEDEILPTIRELGIGLVPYSPHGRGLLTGAITAAAGADGEQDHRRSAYFPRFQGEALLAQGDDAAPIPGTKRVAYLEENLAAADVILSADDLLALEDAVPREAVLGERYGDMSHIDR